MLEMQLTHVKVRHGWWIIGCGRCACFSAGGIAYLSLRSAEARQEHARALNLYESAKKADKDRVLSKAHTNKGK